jgi:methyl-accepting chemotaxis protein
MITKIMLVTFISTLISSGSLFLVYYLRYKTVIVYQLDKFKDLSRENIFTIIFPALIISAVVSILISVVIGLYSSRKYAVPIYKLEQWITLLKDGKVCSTLRFREHEEMKELSNKCNQLGAGLKNIFTDIRRQVELLKQDHPGSPIAKNLDTIISKIELESVPIEVNTSFYQITTVNNDEQKKDT